MLSVGERAPDFCLRTDDGRDFRLSEECAQGPLVVYFYPKDETKGCTMQACSFRDASDELAERGVRVVGISADGEESHRTFRARNQLNFTLLSDEGSVVARQFGVKKTLGLVPGRATFVLGPDRKVILSFSSQLRPDLHVKRVLEVLR